MPHDDYYGEQTDDTSYEERSAEGSPPHGSVVRAGGGPAQQHEAADEADGRDGREQDRQAGAGRTRRSRGEPSDSVALRRSDRGRRRRGGRRGRRRRGRRRALSDHEGACPDRDRVSLARVRGDQHLVAVGSEGEPTVGLGVAVARLNQVGRLDASTLVTEREVHAENRRHVARVLDGERHATRGCSTLGRDDRRCIGHRGRGGRGARAVTHVQDLPGDVAVGTLGVRHRVLLGTLVDIRLDPPAGVSELLRNGDGGLTRRDDQGRPSGRDVLLRTGRGVEVPRAVVAIRHGVGVAVDRDIFTRCLGEASGVGHLSVADLDRTRQALQRRLAVASTGLSRAGGGRRVGARHLDGRAGGVDGSDAVGGRDLAGQCVSAVGSHDGVVRRRGRGEDHLSVAQPVERDLRHVRAVAGLAGHGVADGNGANDVRSRADHRRGGRCDCAARGHEGEDASDEGDDEAQDAEAPLAC